jgi:hypothetical protein
MPRWGRLRAGPTGAISIRVSPEAQGQAGGWAEKGRKEAAGRGGAVRGANGRRAIWQKDLGQKDAAVLRLRNISAPHFSATGLGKVLWGSAILFPFPVHFRTFVGATLRTGIACHGRAGKMLACLATKHRLERGRLGEPVPPVRIFVSDSRVLPLPSPFSSRRSGGLAGRRLVAAPGPAGKCPGYGALCACLALGGSGSTEAGPKAARSGRAVWTPPAGTSRPAVQTMLLRMKRRRSSSRQLR